MEEMFAADWSQVSVLQWEGGVCCRRLPSASIYCSLPPAAARELPHYYKIRDKQNTIFQKLRKQNTNLQI
ncbi:hypothetical protein LJC08_03725 [Methanimicrococcus sp. OttesenSCG-928-J09]|nr:hypothetical protein [Methanimicrococcus sp. OttesenSCG-928-J09]